MVKFFKKETTGNKIKHFMDDLILNKEGVDWLKKNFDGDKIGKLINPILEDFAKCGKETNEATQLVYLGSVLGLILKNSNVPEKERKALIDSLEKVKY